MIDIRAELGVKCVGRNCTHSVLGVEEEDTVGIQLTLSQHLLQLFCQELVESRILDCFLPVQHVLVQVRWDVSGGVGSTL